jgi:hypothetical protein
VPTRVGLKGRVADHEPTQHYLARRVQQKADNEIRRCLKRYTARYLFRLMEAVAA